MGALALGLALSSPDRNRTNLNASAIFAQQHALELPAKHAHVEPFYSPMAMHRFAALVAHAHAIARVAYPGWLESALRTHQDVRSASAPVTAGGRTSVIADEPLHTGVAGRDEPLRGLHAGSLIQPRRDVLFKCVAKRLGPGASRRVAELLEKNVKPSKPQKTVKKKSTTASRNHNFRDRNRVFWKTKPTFLVRAKTTFD